MAHILIADDHELVRDTIAAFLSASEEFTVRTASNLSEAFDILSSPQTIDLVILDYQMPGMDGLEGLRKTIRRFPGTKTAILSGVASAEVARQAIELGALGYFPKSIPVRSMIGGIRRVLAGEAFLELEDTGPAPVPETVRDYGLTPREIDILKALKLGQSNQDIADAFGLRLVTVKFHVRNIMTKLGVTNRTQAALLATEASIV